jgi:hypothetical protein
MYPVDSLFLGRPYKVSGAANCVQKMQRLIRCDDQWKCCGGEWLDGVTTNRARACIHEILVGFRKPAGIPVWDLTVGVLGVNGFKT